MVVLNVNKNTAETENTLFSYFLTKLKQLLRFVCGVSDQYLESFVADGVHFSSTFLNFDDFQLKILKVFVTILIINVVLIVILWNRYRVKIYERFIQPESRSVVEELRKSVSQLKLPRGHSPRI